MGKRIIFLILRWLWLIILATVIAMFVTYWFAKDRPITYQAQSLLIVGPGIDSPSPDLNMLRASSQLMLTYAEMPTTEPFLKSINDDLGLNLGIDELRNMIELKSNTETQVLSVVVKNENPDLAVAIANKTADKLVELSPSGSSDSADIKRDQIQQRVKLIEESILDSKSNISKLEEELALVSNFEAQSMVGPSSVYFDSEKQLEQLELNYQNAASDQVSKRQASFEILNSYLIPNTTSRIEILEDELKQTSNIKIQQLIIEQLTKERNHLSDMQTVLFEMQRLIGDQTLESRLANSEARVKLLEEEVIKPFINADTHRLQVSDLTTERAILDELRKTATEREQAFLQQIANERERISEIQNYRVESRGVLNDQLASEKKSMADSYNTIAALYDQLDKATTNQVKIIERAGIPVNAGTSLWLLVALSGVTGLVLSGVGILAFEFFSNLIQTPLDLAVSTGKPILGVVDSTRQLGRTKNETLVVDEEPESPAAESYRLAGAKLLLSNNSASLHSALLVSTNPSEDSAVVSANLAIVIAQAGHRTVLVDANLHNPRIHKLFGIPLTEGLTDFLVTPGQKPQLVTLERHPGLSIVSVGMVPGVPFELLSTTRIVDLLTYLHLKADIFLISAPAPSFAETLFLALRVNGVILIANTNQTSQEAVKNVRDSLQSVGANLIGSILCENNRLQVFLRRIQFHPKDLLKTKTKKAETELPRITSTSEEEKPLTDSLL